MEIVPAILPVSRADLEEKLARLAAIANTRDVQIDAVDGKFAAPATWPYAESAGDFTLPNQERVRYEADLMTLESEREIARWMKLGCSRFAVHAETVRDMRAFFEHLRAEYGYEKGFKTDLLSFGFAIGLETPLALIEPYLDRVDYVQIMGIARIGRQREPFDQRALARVRILREKYPELPIQIDGGVSLETAAGLARAGASRLVVGSALWNAPDLKTAFDQLSAC